MALALAAVMNLVGALISTKVAATVGEGIIDPPTGSDGLASCSPALHRRDRLEPDHLVLRAALVVLARADRRPGRRGARGLPTRCSGPAILDKVVVPMVLSPLVGFGLGYLFMLAMLWAFRRANAAPGQPRLPVRADRLSSAPMAFGHGTQDAQKTMGIITLALVTSGDI